MWQSSHSFPIIKLVIYEQMFKLENTHTHIHLCVVMGILHYHSTFLAPHPESEHKRLNLIFVH